MRWIWIDIVRFEPGKRMVAIKAVTRGEEWAGDGRAGDQVMPASLLIEGMAQTAGILVGSVNAFREKVILAKISAASFSEDVGPGQTVLYDATIERVDALGASTTGIVQRLAPPNAEWRTIGQVDLMFGHADRSLSGVSLPRENFVFSENFRALLEDAGLGGMAG